MSDEREAIGVVGAASGAAGLDDAQVRALDTYLRRELPGYSGPPTVRKIEGGQSNPTFRVEDAGGQTYVLRKKPGGALLPTAHMIEREYRVYQALQGSGVPVPRVHLLCEDPAILGTTFYVMDFVQGRVFRDMELPELSASEVGALYREMARVLGALHRLDYAERGLGDYARVGDFVGRQIRRWTKQYRAAETHRIEAMDALIEWLPKHAPSEEPTALVHGDYQLYNMVVHPSEPRVVALLDWELSTLGHPFADLAYCCMRYQWQDLGLPVHSGMPSEEAFIEMYCAEAGCEPPQQWNFFLALSFFRYASILQGVAKRHLQGNASSAEAESRGQLAEPMAALGWRLAQS